MRDLARTMFCRLAHFRRLGLAALAAAALSLGLAAPASALSRIKDIVDFEGVRDNMLVGYGLVVGLNGTGDTLNRSIFTRESLIGMLERLGVNARDSNLRTTNVAAVMVTATLPPFARQGARIDVAVSALGDAKSLLGGTLLVTPHARRRRRGLCRGAGLGRERRLRRPAARAPRSPRACRPRAASPPARSSSARSASSWPSCAAST